MGAERTAEGAGVDHGETGRGGPNEWAVRVADEHEAGGGAMGGGNAGGAVRGLAPSADDLEAAPRRPNGVGGELYGVFERVGFGLVALGERSAGGAKDRESRGELSPVFDGQRGQPVGDVGLECGGVATPRDDVVENNVAVGDEHLAVAEVERVEVGNIRVVIPGDEGDLGGAGAEETADLGAGTGGDLRVRAGAGVEGVAVEDQPADAIEERTQLIEAAEPAGAVAVVEVGKDADEAGHDWRGEKRDAETGQCFWVQRASGERGGCAKVRACGFWCFSA